MNMRRCFGLQFLMLGLCWTTSVGRCDESKSELAKARGNSDFFQPTKISQVHLTIAAKEYAAMQPRGAGFPGFGAAPKPKPPATP